MIGAFALAATLRAIFSAVVPMKASSAHAADSNSHDCTDIDRIWEAAEVTDDSELWISDLCWSGIVFDRHVEQNGSRT